MIRPPVVKMTSSVWLASRLVLAVCVAAGVLSGQALPTRAASGASFSTWYWQNPLPRSYSVNAIACVSVSHCIAVGNGGATLRTGDGGLHWTAGSTRTAVSLYSLSCPTQAACYAAGNRFAGGFYTYYLLNTVDGGATWHEIPFSAHEGATGITCLSVTTCLMTGSTSDGRPGVIRSTDSGRTWAGVFQSSRTVSVSCPSSRVCYAGTDVGGDSPTTPLAHAVYRSEDAGTTWQLWSSHAEPDGTREFDALTCLPAGTCLAAVNKTTFYVGDLFLIGSSGKTWTRVARVQKHRFWWVACGGRTACYAYAIGVGLFRSTDGGKRWKAVSFHTSVSLGTVVCPASRTCYTPMGFTVIKSTDGFDHVTETPAVSPIGNAFLGSIQCPTRTTCYASGRGGWKGLVATTNGGHTWAVRPNLPLGYATLTCPGRAVCYAEGTRSNSPPWLVYRTRDGARHWQQLTLPTQAVSLTAPSCPAAAICYVGAELPRTGAAQPVRFRLLVTHDGGATWSVKTAIDKVPGHSTAPGCFGAGCYIGGDLGSPSCPSVTTCFETVPTWTGDNTHGWVVGAVVAATRDGGGSWTVVGHCPASVAGHGPQPFCGPLTCPTVTSCYLPLVVPAATNSPSATEAESSPSPPTPIPTPPPSAAPEVQVQVTHNGGATWHSTVLGRGASIPAIACASATVCRAITSTAGFATANGGTTWKNQRIPGHVSAIACPGVDTCYVVGGMNILATHRP
jgi:photosystem II stability/assembly factor-like uncharacterized protein